MTIVLMFTEKVLGFHMAVPSLCTTSGGPRCCVERRLPGLAPSSMAAMPSIGRQNLLNLIHAQAGILNQTIDEASMDKLHELSDQHMVKLYEEFQDRVIHSNERPIRNVSALLVSIARGLLCGRISPTSGNSTPLPMTTSALGPTLRLVPAGSLHQAQPDSDEGASASSRPPRLPGMYAKAPGTEPGAVEMLLLENDVHGVDEAAVQKIEELQPEDQVVLLNEFLQANAVERIVSPSKWLFSKARSMLVQQRKAGGWAASAARASTGEGQEILELPGVLLDNGCIDKLCELEPEERAAVVAEYQAEDGHSEIRNPSGWLFARSRARIVQRVTGGKARGPPGPPGPSIIRPGGERDALVAETDGAFKELSSIGVDDQALSKLQELKDLGPLDFQQLLAQFLELYSQAQINDPSKWIYSKARSIAARLQQQRSASHPLGTKPAPTPAPVTARGGGAVAVASAALTALGLHMSVPAAGVPVQAVPATPEGFEGLELDGRALAKLGELSAEERSDLLAEYEAEASRKSIHNPSAWVFGRARTKVVNRVTGKGRSDRYAPY